MTRTRPGAAQLLLLAATAAAVLLLAAALAATTTVVLAAATFTPVGTGPLSTAASVYPRASSPHKVVPSTTYWGTSDKAKPTNEWHSNLVFGSAQSPFKTFPYMLKCSTTGLTIGYPGRVTQPNYVSDAFVANMALGATQTLGARQLTGYSKLHATMRFGSASASLTFPLVRGMGYVTGLYWNLTPKITSAHAVTSINGAGANPGKSWTGQKFKVGLNNGQTWLLYAEKSITLSQTQGNILQAGAPLTGYLRMAYLPTPAAEAIFDKYHDSVPMNGTVSYSVAMQGAPNSGSTEVFDLARTTFSWKKYGNQATPLLMYALPHHQDILVSPQYASPQIVTQSIKGPMQAVIGDAWTLQDQLTNVGFYAKWAPPANEIANLKAALLADKNAKPAAQDPYFGGKQVAKMARLAVIADQLGDTATATSIRANLKSALELWLSPTGANHFVYEYSWGGVVSTAAARGWSPAAEFGMGYYNDHHFHFGYFVYAAAVLGLKDAAWLSAYKARIIDLVRDYCNTVNDGVYPQMRMKDAFVGHSFASGLFEFADSKNQESSSESINSYYGLAMFGRTIGDKNLYNWGRIHLASEIRSAKKYWHMPSGTPVYAASFAAHKMAGVVWETKVDYATFFGGNVEFIHGIQMMPFTPITEEYLPADFITEEYPVISTALSSKNLGDGWKGFIFMAHAIINKSAARTEINTLKGYDDGNTKTNTLYWTVTRPGSGMTRVWEPANVN